jgi:hypothetical protein
VGRATERVRLGRTEAFFTPASGLLRRRPVMFVNLSESEPDLIPRLAPLELFEATHEHKILIFVELLVCI